MSAFERTLEPRMFNSCFLAVVLTDQAAETSNYASNEYRLELELD